MRSSRGVSCLAFQFKLCRDAAWNCTVHCRFRIVRRQSPRFRTCRCPPIVDQIDRSVRSCFPNENRSVTPSREEIDEQVLDQEAPLRFGKLVEKRILQEVFKNVYTACVEFSSQKQDQCAR